ncbi:hypothetical protein [Methanosarcina sp. MTP4]|uniref:hypothetical protein n=1 Tax=Methanosarcina sp. MTP4 TaxID=1434100 RepID=UPI000A73F247|nr:hypothetical protein [Methanosarcina sp. MTP4]
MSKKGYIFQKSKSENQEHKSKSRKGKQRKNKKEEMYIERRCPRTPHPFCFIPSYSSSGNPPSLKSGIRSRIKRPQAFLPQSSCLFLFTSHIQYTIII